MKRAKKRPLPGPTKSASNRERRIHFGSSFDDFLAEESMLEETTAVAVKRGIVWQIEQEMAQIPPGTKFEEIDFGPPVGKENL